MNNDQRLYPTTIYLINQRLEAFKQACGIKNRLVSFSILNTYNRKFNWLVVNNERWKFDKLIIDYISKCINNKNSEWQSFLKTLGKLDITELTESITYFQNIKSRDLTKEEEWKEFHYHLLNLYQYYPHEAWDGIDGIIYRNFINKKERLRYAKGKLLTDIDIFNIYPWLDITSIYESDEMIRTLSSQEEQPYGNSAQGYQKDIEYTEATFTQKIEEIKKSAANNNAQSKPEVYFKYIVPLIAGYPDPDNQGIFNGKDLLGDDTIKKLVNNFKYILCFPVYDTYIDKRLYGNFYGNVIIFFGFENDRDEFLNNHRENIEENLFLLIR